MEHTAPGQDYSLPLVKVGKSKLRVQPDRKQVHYSREICSNWAPTEGFGYKWSNPKTLEDLVDAQSRSRASTLHCDHQDPSEATFRFHAFVKTDSSGPPSSWRHVLTANIWLLTHYR
jgi:vacuolar protein sorting-associated protein 13A/C